MLSSGMQANDQAGDSFLHHSKERWGFACVLVFACLIFGLQALHLHEAALPTSDEGVYAEAGVLITHGIFPYRDFHLAHLPLLPLLIGIGLKVMGSMYWVRLTFLALHSVSAVLLYRIFQSLKKAPWAGVVSIIAYLTFHEMVDHDFRFVAIRQLANDFLIWYLYLGIVRPDWRWTGILQGLIAVLTGLLFLPSAAALLAVSLVLLWRARGSPQFPKLRGRSVSAMLAMGLALALLFTLFPNALSDVIGLQLGRSGPGTLTRLSRLLTTPYDSTFIAVGLGGLLLSLFLIPELRELAAIGLILVILHVFIASSYFPHYISAAGPGLATGIFGALILAERLGKHLSLRRTLPVIASLLFLTLHARQAWPPLLREWLGNRNSDYHRLIDVLRSSPGPLLTLEPIYAAEADLTIVRGPIAEAFRLPKYGTSVKERAALVGQACSVLIEPRLRGFLPQETLDQWLSTYEVAFRSPETTLLLTHHPFCRPRS